MLKDTQRIILHPELIQSTIAFIFFITATIALTVVAARPTIIYPFLSNEVHELAYRQQLLSQSLYEILLKR